MLDKKLRLDIRLVKFQDLIRRKPDKPFGYYGLGVQYMLSGKPNMADRMFLHALKIKPGYMPAILGRLEFLISEKKFVSAARFYQKNRELFLRKKIFEARANRITGRLYHGKVFHLYLNTMRSLFVFHESIGILQRMFNTNHENAVVNLLLAMYFLKEDKENDRARFLYNICVDMEGIPDKLRWDLVKLLAKGQPDILKNAKIATMFTTVPEGALGNDYANFILRQYILLQDKEKVTGAFAELQKKHSLPDTKTMWQYLDFCRKNEIWNPTVFICCQKLIDSGWINRVLATTVNELKNKNITDHTRNMDEVLSLYGYI